MWAVETNRTSCNRTARLPSATRYAHVNEMNLSWIQPHTQIHARWKQDCTGQAREILLTQALVAKSGKPVEWTKLCMFVCQELLWISSCMFSLTATCHQNAGHTPAIHLQTYFTFCLCNAMYCKRRPDLVNLSSTRRWKIPSFSTTIKYRICSSCMSYHVHSAI